MDAVWCRITNDATPDKNTACYKNIFPHNNNETETSFVTKNKSVKVRKSKDLSLHQKCSIIIKSIKLVEIKE